MDGQMQPEEVKARTDEIRANMPETYRAIRAKAEVIGNQAYELVRAGIRGKPNSFFAIERGWVVGTPFDLPGVDAELARVIVQFGCTYLIMWSPEASKGGNDGAH